MLPSWIELTYTLKDYTIVFISPYNKKNILLWGSLTFFVVSLIIGAPCFERPCKRKQFVQATGVYVNPVQN